MISKFAKCLLTFDPSRAFTPILTFPRQGGRELDGSLPLVGGGNLKVFSQTHLRFVFFFCLIFFLCISAMTADCAFEDVELGARPLGMGSAFVAAAEGAGAIPWNPAGIARSSTAKAELTMSYMELYGLVSYSYVGYAQPLHNLFSLGGFAAGLGLVSSSDAEGVYRETVLALSGAGEVRRGLSLGSNIKYLSSAASTGHVRIGSSRGLSLDLGCQYHIAPASFGVTLQNLIGHVSYNRRIPSRKYWQRPDFSYKIGACINPPNMDNIILTTEVSDGDFRMGAECVFWNILALRAGLRTGDALSRAITGGFGLRISALKLDYAYVGSEVGSPTSQFSVSINW